MLGAPPMAWHSMGTELCGLHCHALGWRCCLQWVDWTLVLEFGSQFLEHSTVTVCTDCVDITWYEVPNWGPCTWRTHSTSFRLNFCGQSEVDCLLYKRTDFLVGCGLCHTMLMTTVCHRNASPFICYHCNSSSDNDMPYSFGTSVKVGPSENRPYDIQDTTQLH